jgi:hypothetical protein
VWRASTTARRVRTGECSWGPVTRWGLVLKGRFTSGEHVDARHAPVLTPACPPVLVLRPVMFLLLAGTTILLLRDGLLLSEVVATLTVITVLAAVQAPLDLMRRLAVGVAWISRPHAVDGVVV